METDIVSGDLLVEANGVMSRQTSGYKMDDQHDRIYTREICESLRQLPQMPASHLMPTLSPTLTAEFDVPGPILTMTPMPSWPPI